MRSPPVDPVRRFTLDGGLPHHPLVEQWFAQAPSALQLIARRWFGQFRACGTDVVELLHDGHPTACIGNLALGYVAAYRAHVNIGFFLGATLPDPNGLLQGTGRFMRHAKIQPGRAVDEDALTRLIAHAYTDLKGRFAAT